MKRHGNYELLSDAEMAANSVVDISFIKRAMNDHKMKAKNERRKREKDRERNKRYYEKRRAEARGNRHSR